MVYRREVLAGIPAAVMIAGTPAGAVSGRPAFRQGEKARNRFERTDWAPHYTIDIEASGRANVTLTLEGSEIPTRVNLAHLHATDVEFSAGENALTRHDNDYEWDTTETRDLEYSVQLGELSTGSSTFGVFDDALISHVSEVLPTWNWDGHRSAAPETFRYTLDPPDGWTAVAGGTRTGERTFEARPRNRVTGFAHELVVVGDVTVHSRTISGTEFRVVSMPTATGEAPEDVLDQYQDAIPRYESYFGHEVDAEKLCVVVPEAVEPGYGGQAFDNSCLVNEAVELGGPGDTFMQEMASLFDRTSGPNWVKNGVRGYLNRRVVWEIGRLSETELITALRNRSSRNGEPIEEPANDSSFHKAEAVAAALDADVRARTDGEATIGDWRGPLNDQRYLPNWRDLSRRRESELMQIGQLESVGRLLEVTGVDYSDFFERYVEGPAYPEAILDDDFSMSDPKPVQFTPFEYASVDINPTELDVGETLAVSFDVTNIGDTTGTLDLRVDIGPRFDGPRVHEHTISRITGQSVELAADETTTVRTDHELAQPGELAVYINGWQAEVVTGTESTPTLTETPTADPASTETPTTEPIPTGATTEADANGFTVTTAVVGLASMAAYLLRRIDDRQ